jgi:hypothetical protein
MPKKKSSQRMFYVKWIGGLAGVIIGLWVFLGIVFFNGFKNPQDAAAFGDSFEWH